MVLFIGVDLPSGFSLNDLLSEDSPLNAFPLNFPSDWSPLNDSSHLSLLTSVESLLLLHSDSALLFDTVVNSFSFVLLLAVDARKLKFNQN